MFTIKHVSDEGTESLYAATEVGYSPVASSTSTNASLGTVWYNLPVTNEIRSIEGGAVYVMNETGKTIATYRMCLNTGRIVAPNTSGDHSLRY